MRDDGEFFGWSMLRKAKLEVPELGFLLLQTFWGQGLATEVANRLIRYGFDDLGLDSIASTTDIDNFASIRVLEKLGFKSWKSLTISDEVLKRNVTLNSYRLEK